MMRTSATLRDDIRMDEYHALPSVGSSLLKKILHEAPKAAWFDSWKNPQRERKHADNLDLGTLGHSLLLEFHAEDFVVVDPELFKSKTGTVPNGWTNNDIRAERDAIRAAGGVPILKSDYDNAMQMVVAARLFIKSLEHSTADARAVFDAFQKEGGISEPTIEWTDRGVPVRVRPDRLSTDRTLIVDVKTTATSASPPAWGRTQMMSQHAYMSVALYQRGVEALCGVTPRYVFLVIETTPPFLCSLIGCPDEAIEIGREKVDAALDLWRRCESLNSWPGYAPRVVFPETPVWLAYDWAERAEGFAYQYPQLFNGEEKRNAEKNKD